MQSGSSDFYCEGLHTCVRLSENGFHFPDFEDTSAQQDTSSVRLYGLKVGVIIVKLEVRCILILWKLFRLFPGTNIGTIVGCGLGQWHPLSRMWKHWISDFRGFVEFLQCDMYG